MQLCSSEAGGLKQDTQQAFKAVQSGVTVLKPLQSAKSSLMGETQFHASEVRGLKQDTAQSAAQRVTNQLTTDHQGTPQTVSSIQ